MLEGQSSARARAFLLVRIPGLKGAKAIEEET